MAPAFHRDFVWDQRCQEQQLGRPEFSEGLQKLVECHGFIFSGENMMIYEYQGVQRKYQPNILTREHTNDYGDMKVS